MKKTRCVNVARSCMDKTPQSFAFESYFPLERKLLPTPCCPLAKIPSPLTKVESYPPIATFNDAVAMHLQNYLRELKVTLIVADGRPSPF